MSLSLCTADERDGMVLLHSVWHEAAVVNGGQNYVLRTDVMDCLIGLR